MKQYRQNLSSKITKVIDAIYILVKSKRNPLENWDFVHYDDKIFFSSFFSMNVGLNDMPPCVPICRGRLPKAPTDTDLLLKYVIPRNNQSAKIIYSDYLANNKYRLFSGDRLVYECTTEFWGVFGGVDTSYENFRYLLQQIYIPSNYYYFHIPKFFLNFFQKKKKNRNRQKSKLLP